MGYQAAPYAGDGGPRVASQKAIGRRSLIWFFIVPCVHNSLQGAPAVDWVLIGGPDTWKELSWLKKTSYEYRIITATPHRGLRGGRTGPSSLMGE